MTHARPVPEPRARTFLHCPLTAWRTVYAKRRRRKNSPLSPFIQPAAAAAAGVAQIFLPRLVLERQARQPAILAIKTASAATRGYIIALARILQSSDRRKKKKERPHGRSQLCRETHAPGLCTNIAIARCRAATL